MKQLTSAFCQMMIRQTGNETRLRECDVAQEIGCRLEAGVRAAWGRFPPDLQRQRAREGTSTHSVRRASRPPRTTHDTPEPAPVPPLRGRARDCRQRADRWQGPATTPNRSRTCGTARPCGHRPCRTARERGNLLDRGGREPRSRFAPGLDKATRAGAARGRHRQPEGQARAHDDTARYPETDRPKNR